MSRRGQGEIGDGEGQLFRPTQSCPEGIVVTLQKNRLLPALSRQCTVSGKCDAPGTKPLHKTERPNSRLIWLLLIPFFEETSDGSQAATAQRDRRVFEDRTHPNRELERLRWPNGPFCPNCGAMDRIYVLKGVKDQKGRVRHVRALRNVPGGAGDRPPDRGRSSPGGDLVRLSGARPPAGTVRRDPHSAPARQPARSMPKP